MENFIYGSPLAHISIGAVEALATVRSWRRSEDGVLMVKDNLPNPEDWRELAQRIQEETDPEKMIDLVRELIAKFDEEKLRKSLMPYRRAQPGPGCPDP